LGTVVLILATSILLPIISSYQRPPNQIVKERVFEVIEGPFFRTEITRLPASLEITSNENEMRIPNEPFTLEFGVLPKNITSNKIISVINVEETPVKVKLKRYGNISPFIDTGNDFVLGPYENRSVMVKASGDIFGIYEGEVQVITKRPKNVWAEWLLHLV
jgi:hypothetical protein